MVLGRMTVRENLLLGAHVRSAGPEVLHDLEYILTLFPRLKERLEQMAGTLSGGEQQMLAIGRGLMGSPRLLMLDEPSLGIAPIMVEKILAAIQDIRATGVTVLLVEQNAVRALDLAVRGYALDLGCITSAGRSADLLKDERVRQAYLGI
jgi:branched-chain amino acid transport system ATP-binding protein